MNKTKCQTCKAEMQLKKGSFTHTVFGKEFTLNKVPYLFCSSCENTAYLQDAKIYELLTEMYRSGKNEEEYA